MSKTQAPSFSQIPKERKMYSIGEFAVVNKISPRMLRHYDKIGLFQPCAVLENGYRCYSSEQISTISLIKKYQTCGFTLAEISRLLSASEDTIISLAKEKRSQLERESTKQDEAIHLLSLLCKEYAAPLPNDYQISYTKQSERFLLCLPTGIYEAEMENTFETLYYSLETGNIHPIGLPLLLSGFEHENMTCYTAVSVPSEIVSDKLICKTLPSGWYLSTFHYGSYDSIGAAYDHLLCYAEAQKYQLAEPFVERYLLDCTHTVNPAEYITEISVKITP